MADPLFDARKHGAGVVGEVADRHDVHYGGGLRVCPGSQLDDGLLDVTIVLPIRTARFLRLFPSVYRGEHVRSPYVRTARARRVRLAAPGMTAYADGERVGGLPVEARAVPGALTVLVPASVLHRGDDTPGVKGP